MKTFMGQRVIQCLLFTHEKPTRSHLMIQLEGGSWYVDTRNVIESKPLTKTEIKRRCLLRSEFVPGAPANVTTYSL